MDARGIAEYLTELGALHRAGTPTYGLLVKGQVIYDEMVVSRIASSQAFVAMWFDDTMKEAYDKGFNEAITNSGYTPLRIDRKEHLDKIDDQIIAEIRRSVFVVADFTGHRSGVYYEAGFARGLGRQVISTCKQTDLSNLHFDVRQYNTSLWESPRDILAPLQNRILALFGAGEHKPDAKSIPVS